MIGEAEARRDATIAEAHAEEQRMEAKLKNDTEIARCISLKILLSGPLEVQIYWQSFQV